MDPGFITGSLSISGSNLTVTGSNAWDGTLLPPTVATGSDNASVGELVASLGASLSGAIITQTVQVGASGASLVSVGNPFQVSFVVWGFAPGTVLDLYRSSDGATWRPVTPSATCTLNSSRVCSFLSDHLSFFAPVIDPTPDVFTLTAQTGKELSTSYESNTITVTGTNTGSAISITGGQYKINSGAYTSTAGTVNPGDTVTVKVTSSNAYSTQASATVTIGGVSATFTLTTKSAPSSGGGGGGGGGSMLLPDVCTGGDTSGSFYDGKCSVTGTGTTTTTGVQGSLINNPSTTTTTSTSQGPAFSDIRDSFASDYIKTLAGR